MLRKTIRVAAMLAVALATPALAFIAPAPAHAAGAQQCETNGNFCLGSASVGMDVAVTETKPGRVITLQPLNQNMDTDLGSLPEYLLEFNATWCVAVTNFPATNVTIHKCNGGSAVIWGQYINPNGNTQWVNKEATSFNTGGNSMLLAGHNNGSQFIVHTARSKGLFYNMNPT